MDKKIPENIKRLGEMKKRQVLMADEKRYLIYYTFGEADSAETVPAEKSPEISGKNSAREEEK